MFSIWSGSHHGLDHRYQHPHMHSPTHHPHPQPRRVCIEEDLGHVQVIISKQKLFVKLDTQGYSPEELEVKTRDGFLIIRGQTKENGGGGEKEVAKTCRKFCRRFLLPLNCKEDELQCELGGIRDDDTILKVTIPREIHDGNHHHRVSDKDRTHSHFITPSPCHHGYDYGRRDHHGYSVSGVECNTDHFVLRLNLARYSPDEVLVKTVGNVLVVEGNEDKEDGGNGGGVYSTSCCFRRRYLLPLNCDLDEMKSDIKEDGRLKVVVPRINTDLIMDHNHNHEDSIPEVEGM